MVQQVLPRGLAQGVDGARDEVAAATGAAGCRGASGDGVAAEPVERMAELALRFCLSVEGVTSVIGGLVWETRSRTVAAQRRESTHTGDVHAISLGNGFTASLP